MAYGIHRYFSPTTQGEELIRIVDRDIPMLVGVVGKPNVGKSTFFSAATLLNVPIDNRPFTTIKPNRGVAFLRVPCVHPELGVKDEPNNSICVEGIRLIPVEIIDCAGLVSGSWQGRGLGNRFLDEVRRADALIQIVDAAGATNEEGHPCPPGSRDPLKDVELLDYELSMWLNQILLKDWRRSAQFVELRNISLINVLSDRLSGLSIRKSHIAEALRRTNLEDEKPTKWSGDDLFKFSRELLHISKPMLIAANKIDIPTAKENIERLREAGLKVVPCCAEAELILRRAAEKRMIKYVPGDSSFEIISKALTSEQLRALKMIEDQVFTRWGTTGVQETINSAYFDLLNMITVYPVEDYERLTDHSGRILPDVYLMPKGSTARELAYQIHSDLGEGFLYAVDARTKLRLGDEYVLKDRDVISIVAAKRRK
jgi:ribosome-binding ATPase YchF (GTP1/OBG family)